MRSGSCFVYYPKFIFYNEIISQVALKSQYSKKTYKTKVLQHIDKTFTNYKHLCWVRFSPQHETSCNRIRRYNLSQNIINERSLNEYKPTPATSNIEKHYLLYHCTCVIIVLRCSRERATKILTKTPMKNVVKILLKS